MCDRGIGEGRGLTETVRLSGRDGSGGALDRYEPIILQIGRSDLVSVADSLQGPGARRAREGCELNASPLGFRTAIGLGTRAGAWPWRMRASEVWPRSRRFGWRQSDCSGRGMGCPAELHRDMGPPVCHIAKDERKGGERASDGAVCGSLSANLPQPIFDQNSRYGMFRPWCAVRGPPTPHPVPCGLNTFSKTQPTPPPISPPQPTSPVPLKYPQSLRFVLPTALPASPMTSLYPPSSYRPPVVRQEGFHLPSASSTNGNNPPSPSQASFDSNGQLFMPQLLSDPFRKFGGDSSNTSMDFSEELASLIAQSPAPHTSHQSSHERSTHSPPSNGSGPTFDDPSYRPQATHNIFEISAPPNGNQHQQQQHPPPHTHNNFPNQFALNPAQAQPQTQQYHNLHEFNPHPHFNSTLPALNSTMRYDPQPPQTHPPAHEHPNPPSFANHFSPTSSEFSIRHSPSPVGFTSNVSRSRSRSRAPATPAVNPEPPSTNGGPTRTIRHKRNSISSVSPPPHHRTQAIVIPSSHPHRAASQHTPTSATSPLSLHTLNENPPGWFVPPQQQQAHDFRHSEFNLPTSESVGNHHSFAQFNPGSVGSAVSLGVSPKDVAVVKAVNGAESEDDVVSKQYV